MNTSNWLGRIRALKLRSIEHNTFYYYCYFFATGLSFTIPIWVAYYRRLLDFPQIALLTVVEALTVTLLEIPTGALADLLGRRKTMLLGLSISALSWIGIAYSQEFWHFLVWNIVSGVGVALVSGADTAILYDSLKQAGREAEFSQVAVKSGFLFRVALIIGSFSGGFLYEYWIGLPYVIRGVSLLVAAFWVALMVEPSIESDHFSWRNYVHQTKQGVAELTRSTYMKKLTLYYLLVGGITWSCLYYFNQPFAMDFSYTNQQMSLLFGGIYLIASLILYGLTVKKGLLTRERVYLGFPILMAVSMIPAVIIPKLLVPLAIIGIQLAGSARFAILDKYTNQEFTAKNRATANSTLNMGVTLIMMVLVQAGSFIQESYSTKLIFSLLGILSAVIILPVAWQLIREHQRNQSQHCDK